jgi:hypothetical protein
VTSAQVVAFARAVEERTEELLRDLHCLVLLARQMQEMHAPKEPDVPDEKIRLVDEHIFIEGTD